MAFLVEELPHLRGVNLVPFMGSAVVNGRVDLREIIENVIAFIPFGVLIGIFVALRKVLKDKCNKVINMISLVCGIFLIGFIGLLIIMN